ncbi:MAG: nucleoside hydrolase [Bacillota bacterium]|jgi:purine nucleosidase
MVKKLVLDVGPGIDAALALATACSWPEVDVLGVSAVAGNIPLEAVAANAGGLLRELGSSARVYKGASMPLHGKPPLAAGVQGAQGPGCWPMEAEPSRISSQHAAAFMAEVARKYPHEVILVTTGPLTNLALALEYHPEAMKSLGGVVLTGGALKVPGDVTPAAESNIYADPDAAELVLGSGLDLTMVGLDVQVRWAAPDVDALSSRGRAGKTMAAMACCYLEKCRQLSLRAPLALLAAVRQDLFALQEVAVQVETRGRHCRGQVLGDWGGQHTWPHKIKVIMGVDARSCQELLMELWTR